MKRGGRQLRPQGRVDRREQGPASQAERGGREVGGRVGSGTRTGTFPAGLCHTCLSIALNPLCVWHIRAAMCIGVLTKMTKLYS